LVYDRLADQLDYDLEPLDGQVAVAAAAVAAVVVVEDRYPGVQDRDRDSDVLWGGYFGARNGPEQVSDE